MASSISRAVRSSSAWCPSKGKERVIAILNAGDFFGEGCLAGQPLHMASAVALAESTIFRIEKRTMIRVLRDEPTLSDMFMGFLLSRNIQFEADLVDQLFNSSERRLARLLLLLANFGKEGKLESVIPPISQELLAAGVGTTRSRINFFMNKFRKLGLIEYNGHLKVHSGASECRRPRLMTVLGRPWIHGHFRGGIWQALVRLRLINFDPQIATPQLEARKAPRPY